MEGQQKPVNVDKFTTSEKPLTFKTIEEARAWKAKRDEELGLTPRDK